MRKIIIMAVTALMTAASGWAQEESETKEMYLTDEVREAIMKHLPTPPSTTGGDFANDFYYYQWGKEQREIEEIRQEALYEDEASIYEIYSKTMGFDIGKKKTPEIHKLAKTAANDAVDAAHKGQEYFKRTKPFIMFHEPSLKPEDHEETFNDKKNSYPSGHSTRGWIVALVLSNLAPEYTTGLMDAAKQYAMLRVIMGRHWKSDIDAGALLSAVIFANVSATPEYQEQLKKARAEYEAIKGGTSAITTKAEVNNTLVAAGTYDLLGRKVDEENLKTGVYVKEGVKTITNNHNQ